MCSHISRYFVGNITRKGINALFTGRALSLLINSPLGSTLLKIAVPFTK
jgi:hypothetical protein